MDVWIVEAGLQYETGAIMGVRSSEALADELEAKVRTDSTYDWVYSSKHTVDDHVRRMDHIT